MNYKYMTLYRTSLSLIYRNQTIDISTADIVSIAMVHNYDTMTFPIIQIKFYSDISVMQRIAECPNDLYVRANLDGSIFKVGTDPHEASIVPVKPTNEIPIAMKAYISHKNIPTSSFDQYQAGIKNTGDHGQERKVPIVMYCYNERTIHSLKQCAPAVYKNSSMFNILDHLLRKDWFPNHHIDPLTNQEFHEQILMPDLDIGQAFVFFDQQYGLYRKGGQMYGDIDKFYLCHTDVNNGTHPISIYVEDAKTNDDMGGMKKIGSMYHKNTLAGHVAVTTNTDLQRVVNSEVLNAINVTTLKEDDSDLSVIFESSPLQHIITPEILHKTKNPYMADQTAARSKEQMTKVDVSGIGFDIDSMKVNSRYNLIFDSPVRGVNMDQLYRPTFCVHLLRNMDANLFIAKTTMNLCSN